MLRVMSSAVVTVFLRTMAANSRDPSSPDLSQENLGVRVPTDVTVTPIGTVGGTRKPEGMSVFDEADAIPIHHRPRVLGGLSDRPLWELPADAVQPPLQFANTRGAHWVIAPAQVMALPDYVAALEATAPAWSVWHA